MTLIWKNIQNTSDRYKISNNGKIYDNLRKKELMPSLRQGYRRITITFKDKRRYVLLHRLVYKTFKGDIKSSQHVYHIDDDVNNNYIDNLKMKNPNECKIILPPPKLENEIWKDIGGYENRYKISNLGRIYSNFTNSILKSRAKYGYKVSQLVDKNGIRKKQLIHRLVAQNFIGNIPENMVVDHIDRNKLNNNNNNLRIVTSKKNSENRQSKSLYIIQQYDLDGKLLHEYNNTSDIMKKFNIKSLSCIYMCISGKQKTAYGSIWKYKNKVTETIKDNNFIKLGIVNGHDFSNYKINKLGQVVNIKTGKLLKQRTYHEYYCVTMKAFDDGKRYGNKIHRLLAISYILNSNDKCDVINHIDENKLNNNLDNLEWTNTKKNIQHSCAKKVKQIDIKTNKIIKIHNSITDVYRSMNKKYGSSIRNVCNGKHKTAYGYKWSW